MKLDFSKKQMDIGTFNFNLVRTMALAGTGGAEISECLLAAERIKDNDLESWVREWAILAEKVARTAEQAMQSGQTITAQQAYLRASNYYRAAMFSLPDTDPRLFQYLTLTRDYFHAAAKLFTPPIEVIDIPLGDAHLPGYFLSAGSSRCPTLIALNGGDSTNEELVHWLGFAAVARGWNFLVFEGPGQWSALQLNPGLVLRPDYEVPVGTAVDYLVQREDVDPDKIALFGPSMGSIIGARVAAHEPRIKAFILDGLVPDVYEAWHAVWPAALQNAGPGAFDTVFSGLEKVSTQLHGAANHFRWMMGVSKPHEMMEVWKLMDVRDTAPNIHAPVLLIYGEAEAAQSNEKVATTILRYMKELTCPAAIHMFSYEDGWAATHCQVGAIAPMQALVFDWLEKTVNQKGQLPQQDWGSFFGVLLKYMRNNEAKKEVSELAKSLNVRVV